MTPTPCSAEIEPPSFMTTAWTASLISSHRARKPAVSAPTSIEDAEDLIDDLDQALAAV
jgi:hypothetical protein